VRATVSRLFGKDQEKSLNVRIPAALHNRVKVYCAANEMAVKNFVIQALEEKLTALEIELTDEQAQHHLTTTESMS
jgi:hypothetical protein